MERVRYSREIIHHQQIIAFREIRWQVKLFVKDEFKFAEDVLFACHGITSDTYVSRVNQRIQGTSDRRGTFTGGGQ